MQDKNAKLNTALLVFLILIALFCAWKIVGKNEKNDGQEEKTPSK